MGLRKAGHADLVELLDVVAVKTIKGPMRGSARWANEIV